MDAFVARQPIFDRQRNVYGYELLFRSGTDNHFSGDNGDHASSAVISDSLHVHGFDALTGGKKGFINITRSLLMQDLITVLPSNRTVVELLENIEPDAQVIEACRALRKAGYLVAMDDFVFEPKFEQLLHEVDIIKIDFMGTTPAQRLAFSKSFAPNGTKLLAEKVETHEEFKEAMDLGYAYFQGFFFCKPQMVQGKDVPTSKLGYLRFLQKVNEPHVDFDQLEAIIKSEVSLSFKLLKYLNSAGFGLRVKVTSLKQALMLLGVRPLRKWASLMALSSLRGDKPMELLITCLVRARFCELAGLQSGLADRELDLFLTGMLSIIDALVDRSMGAVLSEINIADDVKRTLLGEKTSLSNVYNLVLAYERGRWDEISRLSKDLSLGSEHLSKAYQGAIAWAEQMSPS